MAATLFTANKLFIFFEKYFDSVELKKKRPSVILKAEGFTTKKTETNRLFL